MYGYCLNDPVNWIDPWGMEVGNSNSGDDGSTNTSGGDEDQKCPDGEDEPTNPDEPEPPLPPQPPIPNPTNPNPPPPDDYPWWEHLKDWLIGAADALAGGVSSIATNIDALHAPAGIHNIGNNIKKRKEYEKDIINNPVPDDSGYINYE